ncbi:MAG: C4-type zinc ribbon domain-containing protein [Candidatus Zixiibacteriota bacterium]
MLSDIELLLKLQVIDYDLGELERSKEYIPDMMENLKREIKEAQELFQKTEKELSESQVMQKSLELEISVKQEELKKLQGQMMSIKTNKEYDALISQIDNVKEAISERETQVLELIEKVEKLNNGIEDYRQKSTEIADQNEKQLAILKEKMDSVGTKISIKEDERLRIGIQVPKRTMSVYERVRKNRGGDVVVAVKKRACGACYKALPPHRIQEIKRGDQIITCDNCGRMLIWHEGESE